MLPDDLQRQCSMDEGLYVDLLVSSRLVGPVGVEVTYRRRAIVICGRNSLEIVTE